MKIYRFRHQLVIIMIFLLLFILLIIILNLNGEDYDESTLDENTSDDSTAIVGEAFRSQKRGHNQITRLRNWFMRRK